MVYTYHSLSAPARHYDPYPHPSATKGLPPRLLEIPATMCYVRRCEEWVVVAARLHVFLFLTQRLYRLKRRSGQQAFTFSTTDLLRELGWVPAMGETFLRLAPAYNEVLMGLHGTLLCIPKYDQYKDPTITPTKAIDISCTTICSGNEMPMYHPSLERGKYPPAYRMLLTIWPVLRRSEAKWWRRIDVGRYRQLLRYGRTHHTTPIALLRTLHIWALLSALMWEMRAPIPEKPHLPDRQVVLMGAVTLRHIQRKTQGYYSEARINDALRLICRSRVLHVYIRSLPHLTVRYPPNSAIHLSNVKVAVYMTWPCSRAIPHLLAILVKLSAQTLQGDDFLLDMH